MKQNLYEASNSVTTVDKSRFSKSYVKWLLKADETTRCRQKFAQELVTYLCGKYGIPVARVVVTEKTQPKIMKNGRLLQKTLGTYTRSKMMITVYNRTAVKKQVVSINTFVDTLLHEFIHHYDISYLKFCDTIHTAGFYKRITDLKEKLS